MQEAERRLRSRRLKRWRFSFLPFAWSRKGATLSDRSTRQRAIQVEQVTMRSAKAFSEVKANLERLVPKLDEKILQFIASGEMERLKQALEEGPEQFGDEQVSEVARGLDAALESALERGME
jgi:hypothetical protein